MGKAETRSSSGWLTLQDASKKLGVSQATLRQWADKGKVRVFRTPGGHRRFSASDMDSLTVDHSAPHLARQMEKVVHSALGRTRLEVASGRLETEPWYRKLDEGTKEQHRLLGRRISALLIQALHSEQDLTEIERRARALGHEYGNLSLKKRMRLADSVRAFLFFRDYLFEDLIEMLSNQNHATDLDVIGTYRSINRIINDMLVAMIEMYPQEKRRA